MNKTIYITDLDGTFLDSNSKLSDKTKEKLIKLLDNGLLFTVSTLRSIESIKTLFSGINLNLPIIELNGALITDFETKERLVFNDILSSVKAELIRIIENNGHSPVILSHERKDNLYFKEILNDGMTWYYDFSKLKNDSRLEKYTDIEEILDEKWMGLTVIEKFNKLEKLERSLKDKFSNDISVNITESIETPGFHWLTIHSKQASKSNGIKYLKEVCGYEDYKIVSFGDQPVDLAMFEVSDVSIAVENAHADVKNKADLIIGHHNSDAVIDYIENDWNNRRIKN